MYKEKEKINEKNNTAHSKWCAVGYVGDKKLTLLIAGKDCAGTAGKLATLIVPYDL